MIPAAYNLLHLFQYGRKLEAASASHRKLEDATYSPTHKRTGKTTLQDVNQQLCLAKGCQSAHVEGPQSHTSCRIPWITASLILAWERQRNYSTQLPPKAQKSREESAAMVVERRIKLCSYLIVHGVQERPRWSCGWRWSPIVIVPGSWIWSPHSETACRSAQASPRGLSATRLLSKCAHVSDRSQWLRGHGDGRDRRRGARSRALPSQHPPTAASRNQVAKTVNPEGRPSPRRRLKELRRVKRGGLKQRIQATFGDINVGLLPALRHLVDTIWTATSESGRGAL